MYIEAVETHIMSVEVDGEVDDDILELIYTKLVLPGLHKSYTLLAAGTLAFSKKILRRLDAKYMAYFNNPPPHEKVGFQANFLHKYTYYLTKIYILSCQSNTHVIVLF